MREHAGSCLFLTYHLFILPGLLEGGVDLKLVTSRSRSVCLPLWWSYQVDDVPRSLRSRRGEGDGDVDVDEGHVEVSLTDVPARLLRHGVLQGEGGGMTGDQRISHVCRAVRPEHSSPESADQSGLT